MRKIFICMMLGTVMALGAAADRIEIDGEVYEDVYVRETPRMVYIQFPEEGRVKSFMRAQVDEDAIHIHPDPAHREALRKKWREAYDRRQEAAEDKEVEPRPDDRLRENQVIEIRRPEGEEPSAPKRNYHVLQMLWNTEAAGRERIRAAEESWRAQQFEMAMDQLAQQQAMLWMQQAPPPAVVGAPSGVWQSYRIVPSTGAQRFNAYLRRLANEFGGGQAHLNPVPAPPQ